MTARPRMHFLLQRLLSLISRQGWKLSLGILAALFVFGWLGLSTFEPGSDMVDGDVYWWWFLVTITTVGYGDFFPTTTGGRLVGSVVAVGGIAAMGVVFTQLAAALLKIREALMNGTAALDERDHTVILGYHPGRTEELVRELQADVHGREGSVVIGFSPEQATENPLPGEALAVRGRLSSRDVMERACVARARRVLLDGGDDNETLALAVAVRHTGTEAHVVASLADLGESREQVLMVDPAIECVPESLVTLVVQALQDPGISRLYNTLMSNLRGSEGYQMLVPEGAGEWPWGDLFVHFKREHDATLLAAGDSHAYDAEITDNPGWEHRVAGGMSLYYIADERIPSVEWARVGSQRMPTVPSTESKRASES